MKLERSAGVVLFRDVPGGERVFLLLDYGRHWDYAKGHVEPGEDDRTAALRELAEETGVTRADILDGFAHEMFYVFKNRHGGMIRKDVMFYVARTDKETIRLSHEHVGYAWLPAAAAVARLTYRNAKDVMEKAIAFLETNPDV